MADDKLLTPSNAEQSQKDSTSGDEKKTARYTKNAKDVIADWRREHPTGHKCELEKLGIVSHASINRHWDTCGEGDRPLSAAEQIIIWRNDNPRGTKAECQSALGLSRRSVFLRWNEVPQPKKNRKKKGAATSSEQSEEIEDSIKIAVDKNGQQFFDF